MSTFTRPAKYRVNKDYDGSSLRALIADHATWQTQNHSMHGEKLTDGFDTVGKLPREWVAGLNCHVTAYIIYSYKTPIAWLVVDPQTDRPKWIVPDVWYSVTTAKHQQRVRLALRGLPIYS